MKRKQVQMNLGPGSTGQQVKTQCKLSLRWEAMRRMGSPVLFESSILSTRFVLGASALVLLTWVARPSPVAAQDAEDAAPTPAIAYVSNAGGGITEVNTKNNSVIATAPFPNNANGVIVTPDGRRIYATNRDVPEVTVFDASTNVPLAVIPVGSGTQDNLGVAVSPDGGLVYVANQVSGTVTVIDTETNKVIQTIATGIQPIWITFSADGSRVYVPNQVSGTVSVIATASGTVIHTIPGFLCPFQSKATVDGTKLLVSSQCDGTLKVVNLATDMVVNSIPAGAIPRGIALSPDGTLAYVANFGANTVQVIDVNAQRNLNTPITVGSQPWGIAMTPQGKAYAANFGDGTISVIDSATNTVTATLNTRVFPEDVTVSTTARPRVLNYEFQSIAPSGSPYSLVRSLNNRGDAVGDYFDSSWVGHGFLRTSGGVFTTIDPPGSTATSAFAVNDFGVIVGAASFQKMQEHSYRNGSCAIEICATKGLHPKFISHIRDTIQLNKKIFRVTRSDQLSHDQSNSWSSAHENDLFLFSFGDSIPYYYIALAGTKHSDSG